MKNPISEVVPELQLLPHLFIPIRQFFAKNVTAADSWRIPISMGIYVKVEQARQNMQLIRY